jgi:hypothetical protein
MSLSQPFSKQFLIVFTCFSIWGTFFTEKTCAQCVGLPISTFPYLEDFESGPNGWASGGLDPDWAWGTPAKAVINSAGTGTKCWISGGLTASFYNLGQRSFVESPCFNFTNLEHPYIRLKVWWDTEFQYDGANLQYTINDGSTWINVGSANDPEDCLNKNWYNHSPIVNLSNLANPRHGWSGNTLPSSGNCAGGNGSGGWKIASHCMPNLANQPNVRFRITFGAGTTCNGYDGFAFDDVFIGEAPAINAAFNALCGGPNTFNFKDLSDNCPETWKWDFGDPNSGANNTSTAKNPSHTFSAPGEYTVTLVVGSDCSGEFSITGIVKVLGITLSATPVLCAGGNTGSATATIIPNGVNPIVNWGTSPAQTGLTANNLSAGVYNVSVAAFGACPTTTSITISEPPILQVNVENIINSLCALPNGAASVAAAGGVLPYTYTWSAPGGQGNTLQNVVSGNYSVTVSDANGCQTSTQFVIGGLPPVAAVLSNVTNARCFNESNGSLTVSAINGTAPFVYSWSTPGGNQPTLANIPAGLYTVTITDANNCSVSLPALVNQPGPLGSSAQITPADCGASNGGISITSTGGVMPYTYNWSPGNTNSAILSNVPSGIYFLTLTDQNNCTLTDAIQVNSISSLSTSILTQTATSCFEGMDGTATATVNGGSPPYSYTWLPAGGNSSVGTGLSAGIYSVQVMDVNQCVASALVTIEQPQPIQQVVSLSNANCNAPDGSASILTTGGAGPYAYQWSAGNSTSASANNLFAGLYAITITDQKNCKDTLEIEIPQNQGVSIQVLNQADPSCHQGTDGTIVVSAMGGVPPYQFIWPGTGASGSGLSAGAYAITVSDVNACLDSITVTLLEPEPLEFEPQVQSVPCFGLENGVLAVGPVSNGLAPYMYALNQSAFSASGVFEGLPAGNYILEVMDAAGCTAVDTLQVPEPTENTLNVGPDQRIYLGETVQLNGIVSDPGRIIRYQWQPSLNEGCDTCSSSNLLPLTEGIYTLTAIDTNGCIISDALFIQLYPGKVFIPNVFNPESKAPNNHFYVVDDGAIASIAYLRVFDRWGDLVFENRNFQPNDSRQGWDGRFKSEDAPAGVYTYTVGINWISGQFQVLDGDVTILR